MPTPTLKVIPTSMKRRMLGICGCLTDALDDHATFDCVLVVAVIKGEGGERGIRVYSSDMNRLERLGLFEEGKDTLLQS